MLKIEHLLEKGNGYVAQRIIEQNELLLTSEACAVAVLMNVRKRVCAECLQKHDRAWSLHCPDCDAVSFCSQECSQTHIGTRLMTRSEAIRSDNPLLVRNRQISKKHARLVKQELVLLPIMSDTPHGQICSALKKLKSMAMDFHEKGIIALALYVIATVHLTGSDAVSHLESHHTKWSEEKKCAWRKGIRLIQETHCGQAYTKEALYALVSRIECNNFGFWNETICYARLLFLEASFFNHSCMPNVTATLRGKSMEMRSNRRIEKGEELCIAYIDTGMPKRKRKEQLLQEYSFECQCSACAQEKEP